MELKLEKSSRQSRVENIILKRTPKWDTQKDTSNDEWSELLELSFFCTHSFSQWLKRTVEALTIREQFLTEAVSELSQFVNKETKWKCHQRRTARLGLGPTKLATAPEQRDITIMSTTRRTTPLSLPYLYRSKHYVYWNDGPARSALRMTYWSTSIYLSYKKIRY